MIYFTGDIHGDIEFNRLETFRSFNENDTIFVAGDFGYCWDKKYEAIWNEMSKTIKAKILITPGNHENYDRLYEYPQVEIYSGKTYKMNENTFFLKHGEIFEIEDYKILSFGGANSMDKANRLYKISWWPQEVPSYSDYLNAIKNLKKYNWNIDILLTHTPDLETISKIFFEQKDEVAEMISRIKSEIKEHNPSLNYFNISGHLHKLFILSNTIGLYNTIISINKDNGIIDYNFFNKKRDKNENCNNCSYSVDCPINFDMNSVVCAIYFKSLN